MGQYAKDLFSLNTLGDKSFLTTLYNTVLVLIKPGPVKFNFKNLMFSSPSHENEDKYEHFV